MLSLLLLTMLVQDHHYLDGVEILMRDGSIIKTISDLREDRFFYTWEEEGTTVSVEKKKVRSIRYFSMLVKGPAPRKKTKTALQRRISGQPIAYQRDGATYLKVMHVDARGRSADGTPVPNRVKELFQSGHTDTDHEMAVDFQKSEAGTLARFRFYSLRGKLLFQTVITIDKSSGKKKKIVQYPFTIPNSIDLKKLGLVEVFSEAQ